MLNRTLLKAGLTAALVCSAILAAPAVASAADPVKTSTSFKFKFKTDGSVVFSGAVNTKPKNVKACREGRRVNLYRSPIGGGATKKVAYAITGEGDGQRYYEWEIKASKRGVYSVVVLSTSECGRGYSRTFTFNPPSGG